jgi:hypothetical protein
MPGTEEYTFQSTGVHADYSTFLALLRLPYARARASRETDEVHIRDEPSVASVHRSREMEVKEQFGKRREENRCGR